MKPRRSAALLIVFACVVSSPSVGCGEDETPAPVSPDTRAASDAAFAERARATVKGYAKVGRTMHDEAMRLCKLLEKAVEDFIKAPSPELLEGAKVAWRTARDAYSRAEAFRFAGGPLDTDLELAARIESSPADITLLEGEALESGGILDELMLVPDLTGDALRDAARGKNVQLGWHAIEGMLYGAAVLAGGPARPYTDFVNTSQEQRNARRGKLAAKLVRVLIEDFDIVANQWDADRTESFAQKLVRGPLDAAFTHALGGVAAFAREDVAAKKLGGPLAGAPEVSDASDSTRADVASNALGIEGLFFAREGRVAAPSFVELLRSDDASLADALARSIADARASVDRCPAVLAEASSDPDKREATEASRDAHLALASRIDAVLRHYALAR